MAILPSLAFGNESCLLLPDFPEIHQTRPRPSIQLVQPNPYQGQPNITPQMLAILNQQGPVVTIVSDWDNDEGYGTWRCFVGGNQENQPIYYGVSSLDEAAGILAKPLKNCKRITRLNLGGHNVPGGIGFQQIVNKPQFNAQGLQTLKPMTVNQIQSNLAPGCEIWLYTCWCAGNNQAAQTAALAQQLQRP